jgi:hypothetical protein
MKRWIVTRGKLRSSRNLPERWVRMCAAAGNDMPRSGRQPRFLCADHHRLRRVSADCWPFSSCTSVSSDLIISPWHSCGSTTRLYPWAEMRNEPKQPIKTANTMRCIQSSFRGTDWYTARESPSGGRISAGYAAIHATNAGNPSNGRVARGRESRRIAYRDWRDILPPEFASRE